MRIESVESNGFRTLCDFRIDFAAGYCAISGKNNCGKTSVLKIIEYFLKGGDEDTFFSRHNNIKFNRDKTQWIDDGNIDIALNLKIFKEGDSEVFSFIERFSNDVGSNPELDLRVRAIFEKSDSPELSCYVNGVPQDPQASGEILKKLRGTSNLILHNSTTNNYPFFYIGESFVEILEAHFSHEDRESISAAHKNLQSKIRKAAKQHKAELDQLLGKLKDKIQVELTSIDSERASKYPLQIKLNDRVAEVPLQEWGAGTQNRTRVFLSIIEAQHSKDSANPQNRSTPVFLVEEPESFLHPSAQAEFGQVLSSLAEEFGIQIIATTHSPYMLNQSNPKSNFLLDRRINRGKPRETILLPSDEDDWMNPFAENLGVVSSEFHDWKNVFSSQASMVVLVEGELDRDYFEFLRSRYPSIFKLNSDIEIVPYEGKDALKNTALRRFIINKFKRVFVTFDLDAENEVAPALRKIGLEEFKDFSSIGLNKDGCECIEGLLPDVIRASVHQNCISDVNAMMSSDTKVRRSARQRLKRAYLEEFKKANIEDKDLHHFKVIFNRMASAFSK